MPSSLPSRKTWVASGTPETTFYAYGSSDQRMRKVVDGFAPAGQPATRTSERVYLGKAGVAGFGMLGLLWGATRRVGRAFAAGHTTQDA